MPYWIVPATQTLSAIFLRLLETNATEAQHAATYYVYLIYKSPTSFHEIEKDVREKFGARSAGLRRGRTRLLNKGIIARVLLPHDLGENDLEAHRAKIFGREAYLPVSPRVLWYLNEHLLDDEFSKLAITARKDEIKTLCNYYDNNFGKYGLKLENGAMTLHYSGMWAVYTILKNIDKINELDFMLGGNRTFDRSQIKYFKNMLKGNSNLEAIPQKKRNNLKIKILFDRRNADQVENAKSLRQLYNNLEIKYSPQERSGTCRKTIFGDLIALDGRKLLVGYGKDSTDSQQTGQEGPTYIGTIYINDDNSIKEIKDNFDALWEADLQLCPVCGKPLGDDLLNLVGYNGSIYHKICKNFDVEEGVQKMM